MQNWIPKKSTLLFTVSTAVFVVLLYIISLVVVLLEIKRIEDYHKTNESKSSIEEKTRILKSIAENNKYYIDILRNFFVKKGDEVRFIEQIEQTAKDSEIKFEISLIDVKPNQVKNFKEDVTVRMNIEGPWDSIMLFVDRLEKMEFGVSIQNFNLDTKSESGWSGFVEFTLFREK